MRHRHLSIALAAVVLLAGCTKNAEQTTTTTSAPPGQAMTNPTDFQLYAGASVIDVQPFKQTINAQTSGQAANVLGQGNGTYSGHEVLAKTPASTADLRAWLKKLDAAPPTGYVVARQSAAATTQEARLREAYGIDYAVFKSTDGKRGAVVLVMDPQIVHQRFGKVLDLLDKYNAMPPLIRKPIEDQIRQRTGHAPAEYLDKSNPVGLTVNAMRDMKNDGKRAIILVEATKE